MIILNEREYAEKCLERRGTDSTPYITLPILAKYYYHKCGYRKKKIASLLLDYLKRCYPRYEFNEAAWEKSIKKMAANAGDYKLHEISGVKVTKKEIEIISSLHNKVLERLMFTMLCLAKLGNAKNPNNKGWVNADSKDIFSYARISCKADDREIKIGKLWQVGLLAFPRKNDNLNCRVKFIDDEGDEALFVSDFRELGYEYRKYMGESFFRCNECGILTPGNKTGTRKYCKDCGVYVPKKTKTVVCIDCGIPFEVSSKNNKTVRCSRCQAERNKEIKRDWKRNSISPKDFEGDFDVQNALKESW